MANVVIQSCCSSYSASCALYEVCFISHAHNPWMYQISN